MSTPPPFDPTAYTAIQVVMMPRDTNPHGTIFGGVILSHVDMAGAIGGRREVRRRGGRADVALVTVAVHRVEFKLPVFVGDVVRFQPAVTKIGRTSVTVRVDVWAERAGQDIHVTEAELVYVAVNSATGPDRKPVPLFPDPNDGGA